jgi:hypothetical protein
MLPAVVLPIGAALGGNVAARAISDRMIKDYADIRKAAIMNLIGVELSDEQQIALLYPGVIDRNTIQCGWGGYTVGTVGTMGCHCGSMQCQVRACAFRCWKSNTPTAAGAATELEQMQV